jgi:hypothetical protein
VRREGGWEFLHKEPEPVGSLWFRLFMKGRREFHGEFYSSGNSTALGVPLL